MFGGPFFPAQFLISFVVALALIGLIAWLAQLFGWYGSSKRGQQTRLSVIETAAVDSWRRILLVRRDSVEHLILLGEPTDLIIEANIVRARGAMRRERPTQPAEPGWPAPAENGLQRPEHASRAARPPALQPVVQSIVEDQMRPHPEPWVGGGKQTSSIRDSGRVEVHETSLDEVHAGERHIAEMAIQLKAILRLLGNAPTNADAQLS